MTLFSKDIDVWSRSCVDRGFQAAEPKPFVNLYIRITDGCNASCAFCCNGGSHLPLPFNLEKFRVVLDEIGKSGIRLNRISLTGGEPATRPKVVLAVVDMIEHHSACHFASLQLHTNGLLDVSRHLMSLSRIDSLSLSCHHYDLERLSELYGVNVRKDIFEYPPIVKRKLNLSCNLIKGYIDSVTEVEKMITFGTEMGFSSIGFVGLMRLNKYTSENFVDPWSIDFSSIGSLIPIQERTHESNCGKHCRCRNYSYTGGQRPADVYIRQTIDTSYCGSALLFDGQYLRQGFGTDNIIY